MSSVSRPSFTALALLLATAATACSSTFGDSTDRADDGSAPGQQPQGSDDAGPGPKAPEVTGTPDNDSITEEKGIFVSPSGDDSADASRGRPLKTLSAAITTAAKVGKIVFVCTGTYAEPLVVSDSISIIGGLDCGDPMKWKTGAAPSRIQSPTSPAATAKSITAATRLEALDIVAPDATTPGGSSIGLLADHSPNLTIVGSRITAGNAAKGADGTDGIALTLGPRAKGADSTPITACVSVVGSCGLSASSTYPTPPKVAGGVGQCLGAAGHDGTNGGAGGHAAIMRSGSIVVPGDTKTTYFWNYLASQYAFGDGDVGTSALGNAGNDASPASGELGSLTTDGYVPQNGNAGTDGHAGEGGSGGHGGFQGDLPAVYSVGVIMMTASGTGGGAGGCPGLAGGAGGGGGASLGVALIESPIVLDSVAIQAGAGGAAGLGSFGSDPTPGGAAGINGGMSSTAGTPGGNGGVAGVSTNGISGPSVGILTSGAAPTLKGTSKATAGAAAKAIDARPHTDGLGNTRNIPGTPAGISADIKSL